MYFIVRKQLGKVKTVNIAHRSKKKKSHFASYIKHLRKCFGQFCFAVQSNHSEV